MIKRLIHLVPDVLQVCSEVLLGTVKEPLGLKVSGTKGQQVNSRKSGLFARWNKHDDRELGRVLADGEVDWLHHGNETGLGVSNVEALDVELHGNWSNIGMEVKEAMG